MSGLSEGEIIARRRKKLGWNQKELAKRSGVGMSTILRIEKDRNTHRQNYDDVIAAIEKEEALRGIGPTLSTQASTTEPAQKVGDADVLAQLRKTQKQLQRMEVFMSGAVDEIRQALADLDDVADDAARRRA